VFANAGRIHLRRAGIACAGLSFLLTPSNLEFIMMRSFRTTAIGAALLLTFAAAADADGVVALPGTQLVTPATRAQQTANLLRGASALQRGNLYEAMQQRGGNLLLAEVPLAIGGQGALDPGANPDPAELEFVRGRNGAAAVGVFYRPNDDESDALVYNGYSLSNGAKISRTEAQLLSGNEAFLLIEENGSTKLRGLIERANRDIARRFGTQSLTIAGGAPAAKKVAEQLGAAIGDAIAKSGGGTGVWHTSVIHSARVDGRIHEVGNAEPYAYVFGLAPTDDPNVWVPMMQIVQMEYMKRRYTTYLPGGDVGQPLVTWAYEPTEDDMQWQIAPFIGMLVMEYDHADSFQELAQTAASEIGAVAGEASGIPVLDRIGQAISNIIGKMPARWFRDDDDHLDSFYAIEYDDNFKGHGANNNVHLDIMPYNFGFHAAEAAPDLAATNLVVQAGSYLPHQKLSASFSFRNVGTAPTGAWQAKFYLQPIGPGASIHIGTGNGPSLGAGQTHHDEVELSFGSAPAGSYRLRIEGIVTGDAVPGNNARVSASAATIALIAGQAPGGFYIGPDLEASYIIAVPGAYYPSDTVETWFGVDNDGSNAGQWRAHFWAVHTLTGKVTYLATGIAGSLGSGDSYGGIVDLPLTGLSMGPHKLVLQVAGLQGEQSTGNNIVQSIGTIEIEQSLTDL
jgi:hypothetical protein